MKPALYLSILFVCTTWRLCAQGEFKNLRHDEDFFFLKDNDSLGWYDRMKFTPLTPEKDIYFSIGGDIRYQYFYFKNEDWGEAPDDPDGFMLNRLLVHGDLHFKNCFRMFLQLQSSACYGRESEPSPVEQSEMDLHQVFLDMTLIHSKNKNMTLRGGRQELQYGSSRLVSIRDGPNTRQSLDGVKLLLKHTGFKADAFYSYFVKGEPGIFNDRFLNPDVKFWGIYSVSNAVPVIQSLDLYYLGIEKAIAAWNDVVGSEIRHSIGARISGSAHRISYDFEGVFQFGEIRTSTIRAWTISSNTTLALGDNQLAPSIGLKSEFISGDRRAADGKTGTFNPLFPRGAYFGYVALIGPSNLFDIHPSVEVPLSSQIKALVDYDVFWRYSAADGIYNPASIMIYPAGGSGERFIGHQLSATLECVSNKYLFFRTELTWFQSGAYLKSVGPGENIFFAGITATLRF